MVRGIVVAAVMTAAAGLDLAAQSTGTPTFLAPYRPFNRVEFGAQVSDPGQGFALEGFYRFANKRYDFGFRAGFADADGAETIFLAGVDFRTRIVDHSLDFPLDGALTVGLGGQFGNGASVASVPIGISLGRLVELEDSSVQFVPYLHPILAPVFGDAPSGLDFRLGLGVDVRFNRRFELRVAGALGDAEGVSIGFSILR
ncbi:MAG: hypothetical protein FJ206_06245 [Gemmatimonadetes bacterium]|nr:hypothetical protein [Gemmatimonadota bacterium]